MCWDALGLFSCFILLIDFSLDFADLLFSHVCDWPIHTHETTHMSAYPAPLRSSAPHLLRHWLQRRVGPPSRHMQHINIRTPISLSGKRSLDRTPVPPTYSTMICQSIHKANSSVEFFTSNDEKFPERALRKQFLCFLDLMLLLLFCKGYERISDLSPKRCNWYDKLV